MVLVFENLFYNASLSFSNAPLHCISCMTYRTMICDWCLEPARLDFVQMQDVQFILCCNL